MQTVLLMEPMYELSKDGRVAKLMADGRIHLEFMAKVYRKQMTQGQHFVHEHPATAVSCDERAIC